MSNKPEKLDSSAPAAEVRLPEDSPNDVVAATHYIELITFIEEFFQTPKLLSEPDVEKMAAHILVLFNYLDTLTPPDVSNLRSIVFAHLGQIKTQLQVVEGELVISLFNPRDELLLALTLPRAACTNIAKAILSHETPVGVPPEKQN